MSDSNRGKPTRTRSLAAAVCLLISAAAVLAFMQFAGTMNGRRNFLQQSAERACAHSDHNTCHSDYASIRAAFAAEDVVDLGVLQFIAGIVGIILVGLTLQATRNAVREANAATETAKESISLTRESQAIQNRAYMALTGANKGTAINTIVETTVGEVRGDWFVTFGTFKNVGTTPAFDCKVCTRYAIRDAEDAPHFLFDHPDGGSPIFPGVSVETAKIFIPMDEVRNLYGQNRRKLFVWYAIEYKDAFSDEIRRTEICLSCEIGMQPDRWNDNWDMFQQAVGFTSNDGYSHTS